MTWHSWRCLLVLFSHDLSRIQKYTLSKRNARNIGWQRELWLFEYSTNSASSSGTKNVSDWVSTWWINFSISDEHQYQVTYSIIAQFTMHRKLVWVKVTSPPFQCEFWVSCCRLMLIADYGCYITMQVIIWDQNQTYRANRNTTMLSIWPSRIA